MKKIISLLLCLILAFGLTMAAGADSDDFSLGQTWDSNILAGGIYDLYAWVGENSDDYTFQWQVDVSIGDGHWSDLEDNADPYGYKGTDTYHMQFITPRSNSFILGTGWEDIPFRCVITNKKTGVKKSTPNIFMNIFTSDDLPEYLQKQGFGLYEPTIQGAAGLSTTDYSLYTASANAGTQLSLLCGLWRPDSGHLLRQSDFTEDVEIWITENGKTVKTGDNTVYTPYTIGKNAVKIEFKLHHRLGIHDLGYYETKTVNLSTKEPNRIGFATAKSQISLLRERYNESQKLATIPKGTELKVTQTSSGWYQVIYNGLIGYVSSSAVTYRENNPIIDHVDVTIEKPVAGKLPAYTCTLEPDSCYLHSINWLDLTDDRYLEPGEKFQKGHSYQLELWATAKDGFEFKLGSDDQMLTTAMLNGNLPAFTSRAYEQIYGKVIDIRYDFYNVQEAPQVHVCKPTLVKRVEPTCTQSGFEAYYKCECGMRYSDAQGTNAVDTGTWGKIPPLGHLETVYQSDPYMHYKFCGRLNCGEELSQYRGYHSGGTATCQQYAACDVCGKQYGEKTDHKWSKTPTYQEKDGHAHACEYPFCTAHDALTPHIPGPEATQTEPQKCTVCQYILVPAGNHTHKLTKVDAVTATCLTPGNIEYYTCDGCSDWFRDEAGAEPITDRNDVILTALGHFGELWQSDQENHWHSCIVCHEMFGKENHVVTDSDPVCQICGWGQDPTADPTVPDGQETMPTEPQMNAADKNSQNGLLPWYLWVLIFLAIFAASAAVTVIILKRKKGA